jgi:3-ketoacyl-CoA synthase
MLTAICRPSQMYSDSMADFVLKVFEKSGLSPHGTYLPPTINPNLAKAPQHDMDSAKLEAEMVMFGAVDDLLAKTGYSPQVRPGCGAAAQSS